MTKELPYFNKPLHLFRVVVYAACISSVLLLLLLLKETQNTQFFEILSLLGIATILSEAFFTYKYLLTHRENKQIHRIYDLSEHLFNHLFYPFITFFALAFYFLVEVNTTLSYIVIAISFIMYLVYLYYLPLHLHYGHFDSQHGKQSAIKIEFILYLFKFVSYFIINLTIFTYYFLSQIDFNIVIVLNFAINFLYLFFHIFRKQEAKFINIIMAFIFAGITTLFTIAFKASYINLSASIATLFFYITSSVYYHKVDGTFSYKTMAEYGSIALIASILLFSI